MRDVVVVGAGPVGLLLAAELRRHGVDVALLERRRETGAGSRAIGLHASALAALEASGATERLLERAVRVVRGEARSRGRLVGTVRFDRLRVRFPFVATLPQAATEHVLASLAPEPLRGAEAVGITQRRNGVVVRTADGAEHDAAVAVVAGGSAGRALVFRDPRARDYPDRYLMTDAAAPPGTPDTAVVHLDREGVLESFPLPGGMRRYVAWDAPGADASAAARRTRLRDAVGRRDEAAADAVEDATAFGVRRFVAPRLRNGRVFVVGDAAHEVSPIGGQGMNLGLLDAAGLAPVLASWLRTGAEAEPALASWERRRVTSARTAARLAWLNTALGRSAPEALDVARRAAVRAMLAGPSGAAFARAYAMGFDRDAR